MRILRHIAFSFSMFSRIPMPDFEPDEDDRIYVLAFFPLVGALIAALTLVVNIPGEGILPAAVRIILTMLIPILVTGGIHIDGLMDTEDALRSYSSKERRLEILGDPHCGAFAVIALVKYGLIYAAALAALILRSGAEKRVMIALSMTFVISRCCSALTSLYFQKARQDGMLHEETRVKMSPVVFIVVVQLIAASLLMAYESIVCFAAVCAIVAPFTVYYRHMSYEKFGGVTGDTAGWYLTLCETVAVVVLAVAVYVLH